MPRRRWSQRLSDTVAIRRHLAAWLTFVVDLIATRRRRIFSSSANVAMPCAMALGAQPESRTPATPSA